ncbi:aspartate 1-decarboxylase [Nitrospina gracilis]|uniref:aspartate 1-decarboxylase n=1 Tax=Nitrospina gracilis TaxID=35801 RepID=UPI001F00E508|nr:aspartate 1-decarboxylase [Nitrospina gracilis]MCF8721024.1 aspartate 1-decarboxylase [Nitrospina gracilis Nb-211]
MQRTMLTAKLHRATVTDRDIEYEGSIEIDENLMDEVDILAYEQVHIYNINNGNRFLTYVIPGPRNSGRISVNGAAARMVERNDRIIIAAYGMMSANKSNDYKPKVLLLNESNQVVERQGALAFSEKAFS